MADMKPVPLRRRSAYIVRGLLGKSNYLLVSSENIMFSKIDQSIIGITQSCVYFNYLCRAAGLGSPSIGLREL
jgi:hypothetical protein